MQFLIDKKEQDYKTLYKQISWTLSSLLISPLDRIRRQLQISEVGTSSGYVIDLIYKQEGVMGFWKNFMYRIFKELYLFNVCEIPGSIKQMKLKNQYLPNLLKTSSQYLLQTLFYPFDIIQARCEIDLGNKQFSGYFDSMIKTYREFGIGGFFVGLKVYTLKFIRGIYSNDKIQISAFYKASIADSILEILFFQQTNVFSDMSSSRNIQKITNLQQQQINESQRQVINARIQRVIIRRNNVFVLKIAGKKISLIQKLFFMQNNPNNPKFESLRLPSFISQSIVVEQPVIGSGANAIRKIFYQQRFDNFENHHLELFKEKIQQLQDYNPAYHRDEFLLRFLYANKFDQQKSYDHLGACLAINYREGYFKLNDEIENFYRKGCAYIGGRTKDYKPTIVLNTTLIDNFKIVEQALSILCYIVEEYMFERGKVESWIVILKTQDQSVFKLPLDILNQIVTTLQLLYPCTLEALYIIQPSLSLNIQWSRIEEFIKGETIPKITFLNKNQLDLLMNRYEPDQLEKALGGEKIINEYWPPQPWKSYQQIQIQQIQEPIQQNNMFQDVPVAYEPILPQSEIIVPMQNQFIFQSEPQYLQAPYEQPQEEVKKRCVCIKCNKEIDEANKLREKSKVNGQTKSQVIKPPPKPNDKIKEIQVQTDPIEIYPQNPDETYVSYHQKYDNIADSYLDQTILPKQEPKQEQKQEPKEEQKQDEIKKPIKEDSVIEKAQKPAFQNPYFNPQQSQQMEKPTFKQQQSYHPSLQSYQQPIFQPQPQQSLQSYQPQLQQPIYEYQPFNPQNYNYKPQWQASQIPAQNTYQSPVSNNYQQSPQFQVVSAKVEEYDIKQTMTGNIKRYDFSEWDKYNSDGSAYVPQEIQSYKKNYDTYQPYDYKPSVPNYQQNQSVYPYQQAQPIQPNYQQNPSVQPYQQTPPTQPYQQTQVLDLKPSYIPHDQFEMPPRPKDYVPEYRPTEFNPELYRPSDKDSVQQFQYYRPTDPEYLRQYQSYEDRPTDTKYQETAKTQPPQQVNQLYAQKPGQQACQIF